MKTLKRMKQIIKNIYNKIVREELYDRRNRNKK